jgi:hypothetical protein
VNLVAADTILAVHYEPDRHEPFVQPDGRLFEDGASLHRKLFAALPALPDAASLEESGILAAAMGALGNAIKPAQRGYKLNAHIDIREVPDGFK